MRDKRLKNSGITAYELQDHHIENAKVLINREALLHKLHGKAVVAELGVNKGQFSQNIINICCPCKLHLIDTWGTDRYNQTDRKYVEEKFSKLIDETIVEINQGLSTQVLKEFDDNYFDWVYLDTAHTYEITHEELILLGKKVKIDGIIGGHDYTTRSRSSAMKYGVIEAVHEFCVTNNWEFVYITLEWHGHNSFAIKRIV